MAARIRGVIQHSLAPYPGEVLICRTPKLYRKTCAMFCSEPVELPTGDGVCAFCTGPQGVLYVLWARDVASLVHECSHAVLDTFSRIESDPREGCGEPFCYLLDTLVSAALPILK